MSIEVKNITKQFGNVSAVNNVSFAMREGELVALLGPSLDHLRGRLSAPQSTLFHQLLERQAEAVRAPD